MTEKTEQQPQEHDFGPGALLKQKREQQGLSLEEVSTRLKLTIPVLKKIEADDYEGDLPVTFYRGYLKNYAELLELDDVDIGANFRDFCGRNNLFSSPPPRLQGLELDKPMGSNNWLFKAVTTLIILILLFAIYYVVVEKELWKKFVPDSSEEQVQNIDGLPIGEQNSSQIEIGSSEGDSSSQETTSDDGSSEDEPSELLLNDASNSGDADDSLEPSATSGELNLGESDSSESESVSNEQSNNSPQSQVTSGGSISLSFTGDCWVRVQDASGKVLALGIKSAGTNLQLSGQAPYNLTLGKASAVQLTYNGNAIDLSGYSDERAAKLTLGDNS